MNIFTDAKDHYDLLIEEGNDPFNDPEVLKKYMDKWDGELFIEKLEVQSDSIVLEIGVGTGRNAKKVLDKGCAKYTGLDISPKTVERARQNLLGYDAAEIVETDALLYLPEIQYDIVLSSLTFLHIEDKQKMLSNIYSWLKNGGKLVLSIEKDKSPELDYGSRKIKIYHWTDEDYMTCFKDIGFAIKEIIDLEFATVYICTK